MLQIDFKIGKNVQLRPHAERPLITAYNMQFTISIQIKWQWDETFKQYGFGQTYFRMVQRSSNTNNFFTFNF